MVFSLRPMITPGQNAGTTTRALLRSRALQGPRRRAFLGSTGEGKPRTVVEPGKALLAARAGTISTRTVSGRRD
jgi:hypothetical protein